MNANRSSNKENKEARTKSRLEDLDEKYAKKFDCDYMQKLYDPNYQEEKSFEAAVIRQVWASLLDSWDSKTNYFQWTVIIILGIWSAVVTLYPLTKPYYSEFPLELNVIMTFYGVVFGALVVAYSLIVPMYRSNYYVIGGQIKTLDKTEAEAAWDVLKRFRPYLFFLFFTLLLALLLLVSDLVLRLIFGYNVSNPIIRAIMIWEILPYTGMLVLAILGLVSYTMGMGRHEFRATK